MDSGYNMFGQFEGATAHETPEIQPTGWFAGWDDLTEEEKALDQAYFPSLKMAVLGSWRDVLNNLAPSFVLGMIALYKHSRLSSHLQATRGQNDALLMPLTTLI